MKFTLLMLGYFLFLPSVIFAQEIYLKNASFEDIVGQKKVPIGWVDCGTSKKLLPDVESEEVSVYRRNHRPLKLPAALEGTSYVSLYTDFYQHQSAIGQLLSEPLEAGYCYLFNLYACFVLTPKPHSDAKRPKNFEPVKLRIWGGNTPNERGELLAESITIRDFNWTKTNFILEPLEEWTYFIIEAHFDEIIDKQYDGKILLDNASPIIKLDCETVDFDTGEVISDEFDPVYQYYEYMHVYLAENWDRPIFKKGESELTDGAKIIIEEIAEITDNAQNYKVFFVVMKNDRDKVTAIKTALKEAGLKKQNYYVNTAMVSDYQKEWLSKNKEVWVRIVRL